MHEKGLTVRYFMLSFAVGFLVLAVAAMLIVLFVPPQMAGSGQQEARIEAGSYLPSNEEALNILAVVDTGGTEQPKTFLLIRFDPMRGQIPIAALPSETLLGKAGSMATLGNAYDYGAVNNVRTQLENALGIRIERTIKLTGDNVVKLVDLLGGVRYRTKEALLLKEGGATSSLPAAYHQLSGSLFYTLLEHGGYKKGELGRCEAAEGLTAALINQYMPLVLGEESDALFEQFVNLVQTDISAVDFQKLRPAARFMAKLQGEPAFPVNMQWRTEGMRGAYSMTLETTTQLRDIYSPPQKPL